MKNLTKQELIIALEKAEQMLSTAIQDANVAAKNYADEKSFVSGESDIQAKLAFEVGYLGSTVKSTHDFLMWVKEGKKQSLVEFLREKK